MDNQKGGKRAGAGRPKGSGRVTMNAELEAAVIAEYGSISAYCTELVRCEDAQTRNSVLARLLPPLRAVDQPVIIPALTQTKTLTDSAEAILKAIGTGAIPADTGKQIIGALSELANIKQVDEFEQRLKAVEAVSNAKD